MGMLSAERMILPTVPVMLTSHQWREFLTSSTRPKVNMVKYMPFNLSVREPTRKARVKLALPPMTMTTGRGRLELSKAEA